MNTSYVNEALDAQVASTLHSEVLKEELDKLNDKRLFLESQLAFSDHRKWSNVHDFYSTFKNKSKPGLYALVYKPTNEVMYYGVAGKMNQRVRSHVKGFNDTGFVDSTKESQVGKKMFEHDSDLNSWGVAFFETGSRSLALRLEEHYYWNYKTRFNNPSMLGK